jgi:ligand-binding SRPBCC domain-containing protein
MHELIRTIWVPHPRAEVFDFFSKAENLEKVTPPWLRFRIQSAPSNGMREGARIGYSLRVHGVPLRWLTVIEKWNPPLEFIDVQLNGPYRVWRHTHRFVEVDDGTSIEDLVQYELPFGPLGRLVQRLQVARDVAEIFDYRAQEIQKIFS